MGFGEGNDGGSIPSRDELCKLKQPKEKANPVELARIKCLSCSITKFPLKDPIVVCDLGNLYNKETIIEYMLTRELKKMPAYAHIRSMKDIYPVHFAKNENYDPGKDTSNPHVCPVTKEEFNGRHPFIAIKPCGHVIAERALRVIQCSNCPVCEKPFNADEGDVIPLGGSEDVVEELRENMLRRRAAKSEEGKNGKSKKRKERDAKKNGESVDPEGRGKKIRRGGTSSGASSSGNGPTDSADASKKKSAVYQSLFAKPAGPMAPDQHNGANFCSTTVKNNMGL